MWKCRGLTLIGIIQIVKSFAIPKVMSKAGLISLPSGFIKELIINKINKINKEPYSFIWNGKDKINRSALINDIEEVENAGS